MEKLNSEHSVREQYGNAEKLNIRIALHQRYSTNQQPFAEWIYRQYELKENQRILEVGCGDGSMWQTADRMLPSGTTLLLTDFSAGMLETARKNVKGEKVSFLQADIQALPFPDDAFDIVIGNMMLYHVPDLHKGLMEVRRVLKKGGLFYAATYGENGITSYLLELLEDYGVSRDMNKTFTLQNGRETLLKHFDHVELHMREDALAITEVEDLLDYIFSLTSMMGAENVERDELRQILLSRQKDGVIYIPKEYGIFVAE